VVLQILSALTLANTNTPSFVPNLRKRRVGNAGLDSSKISLTFALPDQSLDLSDEERNSDEKIPGPAKKFDVILCGETNEVELEDGNQSKGEGSDGSLAENNKKVGMSNDLNLDGCNSKRDNSSTKRKNRIVGINDSVEICHDKLVSMSESKNADDGYWKPGSELSCHQSRSTDNSGNQSRTTETNRCRNDYGDFRNRNIPDEVKLYLTEESDDEPPQKLNFMPSVDIAGVSDGSTSFCPELSRLAILSSHSGMSVGSPHNFGSGKVHMITVAPCNQSNNDGRKLVNACEVGTQTSLSVNYIEMQEKSATHSSPLPRACTSQSTQVSPPPTRSSGPPPKPQRHIEKSKITGNVLSHPTSRGLNYSYNAQQLVKELVESDRVETPVRPERRRSTQGKDFARSKSADNKSIELKWRPFML
jgi:hypothetical protein